MAKKEMEQISVKNVPQELKKAAEEKAKREQRPLNQVIRELLRDWVKQDKPNK
jgi:predicted HicB family RNase H-like nuclease